MGSGGLSPAATLRGGALKGITRTKLPPAQTKQAWRALDVVPQWEMSPVQFCTGNGNGSICFVFSRISLSHHVQRWPPGACEPSAKCPHRKTERKKQKHGAWARSSLVGKSTSRQYPSNFLCTYRITTSKVRRFV